MNRISYELCVLRQLREKLRCKEVWVEGADRYRNPDEDVPTDFPEQREIYYAVLNQPLDVDTFIQNEKQALTDALAMLNAGMPHNPKVKLGERNGKGSITLSPLKALPEPTNFAPVEGGGERPLGVDQLAGYVEGLTDLRVGFTDLFQKCNRS